MRECYFKPAGNDVLGRAIGIVEITKGAHCVDVPKKLSFFEKVYILVRMIPEGKVASYGQIAAYLGHPRAARTVGWALHGIPEGSDVPWQRVINNKGRITISNVEYSASLQRDLLEEEGIVFGEDDRVDLRVYRWDGPDWVELESMLRGGL